MTYNVHFKATNRDGEIVESFNNIDFSVELDQTILSKGWVEDKLMDIFPELKNFEIIEYKKVK